LIAPANGAARRPAEQDAAIGQHRTGQVVGHVEGGGQGQPDQRLHLDDAVARAAVEAGGAGGAHPDQPVVAFRAEHGVVALRDEDGLVAGPGIDPVVARPAIQHVVAHDVEHGVVAGAPISVSCPPNSTIWSFPAPPPARSSRPPG
jgi:hypothetical protein